MSDVQPEPTNAEQPGNAAEAQQQVEQGGQEPTPGNQQQQQSAEQQGNDNQQQEGIDALPEWAQQEIRNLRKESGNYRTKAKEHEQSAQQLAEKKDAERNDLVQQLAKTLGLVEEEADDPEALVKAATEREQTAAQERDDMAKQLRDYRQKDAIREAADGKVSDPKLLEAVLKSDNAFNELDVNADDFADQVSQRVAAAIETHPALAQVAPTASGVDTSNTNSGTAKQLTREDLKTMSAADINTAAREGKLNHLMTK